MKIRSKKLNYFFKGALTPNDLDLFSDTNNTVSNYTAIFLDESNSRISQDIINACGNNKACILDAVASGSPAVGVDTQQNQQAAKKAVEIFS